MSGGESRPPSLRARYGTLGHRGGGNYVFNRIHWDTEKHRKRMKMIRRIGKPSKRPPNNGDKP
jgi:hypothetical protein